MAPKKTTTTPVPATTEVPPSDTAAPAKKAPVKRQPAAKKAVDATADCPSEPKKRNMTAVPCDFVSAVNSALPEDLAQKLKVKDVKDICEAFVKTLVDKVKKGETVSFTNHMTFKRQARRARTYKNLKTGESINKPPHYVLCMQVKPALKRAFDEVEVTTAPPAAAPA